MNTIFIIHTDIPSMEDVCCASLKDAVDYIHSKRFANDIAFTYNATWAKLVTLSETIGANAYTASIRAKLTDKITHGYDGCAEDEYYCLNKPIYRKTTRDISVVIREVPVKGAVDGEVFITTASNRGFGNIYCQRCFSAYEDAKEYVREGVISDLNNISVVYHTVCGAAVSSCLRYYSSEVLIRQGEDKHSDEIIEVRIKHFYIH